MNQLTGLFRGADAAGNRPVRAQSKRQVRVMRHPGALRIISCSSVPWRADRAGAGDAIGGLPPVIGAGALPSSKTVR